MALEYTLSPTGVIGTEFQLAKKVFASNLIRAFEPALVAYAMIPNLDMEGGVSKETLRWWKMTAGRHIPHSEVSGEALSKKPITVRYEDEETVAATFLSKRDMLMTHYDANGAMAEKAADSLVQLYEKHAIKTYIGAARTAADSPFPGGQSVTNAATTGAISTTYPLTITGSERLQADIRAANTLMFEDDVPESMERFAFMKRREVDVLLKDKTLVSSDFVSREFADLRLGKLLMIDGTWIIPTNNYPQTTETGNTFPLKSGSVILNLDYQYSVAVIATSIACRKAEAEPIIPLFDWIPKNRHWQIGAAGLKGIDPYQVEGAAEIVVA